MGDRREGGKGMEVIGEGRGRGREEREGERTVGWKEFGVGWGREVSGRGGVKGRGEGHTGLVTCYCLDQ